MKRVPHGPLFDKNVREGMTLDTRERLPDSAYWAVIAFLEGPTVAHLAIACNEIEILDLSNIKLGDEGLRILTQGIANGLLPRLRHLVLRNVGMNDKSASELCSALKKFKKLVKLDVRENMHPKTGIVCDGAFAFNNLYHSSEVLEDLEPIHWRHFYGC